MTQVTEEMIEAAARVHCPFAFEDSDTMPIHLAQSRDEALKEVRAILEAALVGHVVGRGDQAIHVVRQMVEAYDSGNLKMSSPEIGEPENDIPYHPWHEQLLHYARLALEPVPRHDRAEVGLRGFNAISSDTESPRVLKIQFDHDVTDHDRRELVEAINAYNARKAEA